MTTPTEADFRAATARALDELDARRDALVSEAETILTRTAPDAALPDEDRTRFETIEADLAALAERRKAHERVMTTRVSLLPGTAFGDVNLNTGATRQDPWQRLADSTEIRGADLAGLARSAIEASTAIGDDGKAEADRLVDLGPTAASHIAATSNPHYRSAFWKLASDPITGSTGFTDAERQAVATVQQRAASLSGASGGYALPTHLDPSIILTNAGSTNPLRRIARNVKITQNVWHGVSSAGVTASWDAEAAEVSDDAPTLASPSITCYKGAAFVPFSIEVGEDWQGMEAAVLELLVDAKDRLEGTAFTTGSGSAPQGIVTALVASSPTSIVASASADTFAIADVYAMSEAVPARDWHNASWMMHRSTLNKIRQFATASNYHAFLSDLTDGNPTSLLGKPVYENSDMDSTYGSGENYTIVAGDFSKFVVVDRIGMSVELVPHLFATANNRPSGERGFYAHWRTGSDCVADSSLRILNVT